MFKRIISSITAIILTASATIAFAEPLNQNTDLVNSGTIHMVINENNIEEFLNIGNNDKVSDYDINAKYTIKSKASDTGMDYDAYMDINIKNSDIPTDVYIPLSCIMKDNQIYINEKTVNALSSLTSELNFNGRSYDIADLSSALKEGNYKYANFGNVTNSTEILNQINRLNIEDLKLKLNEYVTDITPNSIKINITGEQFVNILMSLFDINTQINTLNNFTILQKLKIEFIAEKNDNVTEISLVIKNEDNQLLKIEIINTCIENNDNVILEGTVLDINSEYKNDISVMWSADPTDNILIDDGLYLTDGKLAINKNTNYDTDCSILNYEDRIYLPLRLVSEKSGYEVTWDGEKAGVIVEGENVIMSGIIYNDRTYIKVRDFEKIGAAIIFITNDSYNIAMLQF